MNESSMKADKGLERHMVGMISALSVIFLLGLALATVADYNASTHAGNQVVYNVLLALHALAALGLIVSATMALVCVRKSLPEYLRLAVLGLVAILVSFGCGLATQAVDSHEWYTFGMGTGFLVALVTYGLLYTKIKVHNTVR